MGENKKELSFINWFLSGRMDYWLIIACMGGFSILISLKVYQFQNIPRPFFTLCFDIAIIFIGLNMFEIVKGRFFTSD